MNTVTTFIVAGDLTTYDNVFCFGPVDFTYTVYAVDAFGNFSAPSNAVNYPGGTD